MENRVHPMGNGDRPMEKQVEFGEEGMKFVAHKVAATHLHSTIP